MNTYIVTVDVPAAPKLGHCKIEVDAQDNAWAENKALRLVQKHWACGSPFRAVARLAS